HAVPRGGGPGGNGADCKRSDSGSYGGYEQFLLNRGGCRTAGLGEDSPLGFFLAEDLPRTQSGSPGRPAVVGKGNTVRASPRGRWPEQARMSSRSWRDYHATIAAEKMARHVSGAKSSGVQVVAPGTRGSGGSLSSRPAGACASDP